MNERMPPFYCPFCGDEDLRPDNTGEESAPRWLCVSCRRVFSLKFAGLRLPPEGAE